MVRYSIIALLALAAASGKAWAETPTERGGYLVNTIMTCGNCHTPKGPTGEIVDKAFSGGLSFEAPPFKVTAANITQDQETGIGKWSAADIKKLLRTGVRPNGVPVATVMPTGFYGIITDSDMDAIVSYLQTIKPIKNKVPDPIYKMEQVPQVFPGAEKPLPLTAQRSKVAHGFYLATIGHCMDCHTPLVKGRHDWSKDLGRGGLELPGPWGVTVSRNITTSKSKGIGGWTAAEIKRAITQGIRKDGSKLKPPMGFSYYARMKRADLDALVAYLRTVTAKE